MKKKLNQRALPAPLHLLPVPMFVNVDVVMHFAAKALVGESVRDPLGTYGNNVQGTLTLLAAMARAGVDKLVFSSTCAVYGRSLYHGF